MFVSVVMPTFKHHEFIKKSIKSILDQTHQDFELIVVPVVGDTPTMDVLESIKDSRLRIVPSNFALITHQMNLGILSARGDYFMMFASDDYLYPKSLEKILAFATNKKAVIAYPDYDVGNPNLQIRYRYIANNFNKKKLFKGNYITDVSLIQRQAFMKYFPMRISDKKSRIWRIYKQMASDKDCAKRIFHYPHSTFIYRIHKKSIHLHGSQRTFRAIDLVESGDSPFQPNLTKKQIVGLKRSDFAVFCHSPQFYLANLKTFRFRKVVLNWQERDLPLLQTTDRSLFDRVYHVTDSDDVSARLSGAGLCFVRKIEQGTLGTYVLEDNVQDLEKEMSSA